MQSDKRPRLTPRSIGNEYLDRAQTVRKQTVCDWRRPRPTLSSERQLERRRRSPGAHVRASTTTHSFGEPTRSFRRGDERRSDDGWPRLGRAPPTFTAARTGPARERDCMAMQAGHSCGFPDPEVSRRIQVVPAVQRILYFATAVLRIHPPAVYLSAGGARQYPHRVEAETARHR